MESERLERRHQTRLLEIVRDDFRSGREARLHPWLAAQPAFDGFLRHQAAATITDGFDVLVQLVIARNDHRAMLQHMSQSSMRTVAWLGRGGAATAVWPPSPSQRPTGTGGVAAVGTGFFSVGNASANLRGTSRRPTRSCAGAVPPCSLDRREIQLERVAVDRFGASGVWKRPCSFI